jgi:hypothetical protein
MLPKDYASWVSVQLVAVFITGALLSIFAMGGSKKGKD